MWQEIFSFSTISSNILYILDCLQPQLESSVSLILTYYSVVGRRQDGPFGQQHNNLQHKLFRHRVRLREYFFFEKFDDLAIYSLVLDQLFFSKFPVTGSGYSGSTKK